MPGPIPTNFSLFVSDINAAFGAVYLEDKLENVFSNFATEVPVTTEQLVIAWTGLMPKARVWYGPRVVHSPAIQTKTYVPLPYELTYAMDQFILSDDIHNVYFRLIPDMVRQTKRHMAYELRDMLENTGAYTGAYQLGMDGLSFFNTAHPVDYYNSGLGTYCNDFSGAGQNVTYTKANGGTTTVLTGGAFGVTAFKTLIEYMPTIKGEDSERIGIHPKDLMHPINLEGEVEVVLRNVYFAPPAWGTLTGQVGAAENAWKRYGCTPHKNEFLNDPQMWYLGDTSRAYKPLGWGLREAWKVVPRTAPTDPLVWDLHQIAIGGWARAMPFWGYSFLMSRSGP
jgi:phage major head subunit gpT-like protein